MKQEIAGAQAAASRAFAAQVRAKYMGIEAKHIDIHPSIPWASHQRNAVPQLLHSVKQALHDIPDRANPEVDVKDASTWILGWDKPFKRALNRAVKQGKPSTGDLISDFAGMFAQVNQRLSLIHI